MKIIAINGSPRRTGNTATFLHKALEGAASVGADTECIDLYSLNYKGCLSCFYCKRKDKEHGTCIIKDDLAPVLEKVKAADAVLFGSPIYFMNITSGMQAFLERLLFSLYIYSREIPSVLGKKLPSAFLYTMNATEERAQEAHLLDSLAPLKPLLQRFWGPRPANFMPSIRCNSKITVNTNRRFSRKRIKKRITRNTLPRNCNRPMNWAGNW